MSTKNFNEFMSQLLVTNTTLDFYCDFDKIYANVRKISLRLTQLNYLLGKEDMEQAIRDIWEENKDAFSVLDILIAVRKGDHKQAFNSQGKIVPIESFFNDVEGIIEYIKETGLQKVFQNKEITNLVDYVFGVETGLDTNARKNRSGHIMEHRIARIFENNQIPFRQEVYSTEFPAISEALGEDKKRFDFVVTTAAKTYLMEVNFYSGGGSKLNEVARSYSDIAPKINAVEGFEFVWVTDGVGWKSARNKLEEAFYIIPRIYNLTTIKEFIEEVKNQ